MLPTADEDTDTRYLAYITEDKVGLHIMPLDGNPHNAIARIAHPSGVSQWRVRKWREGEEGRRGGGEMGSSTDLKREGKLLCYLSSRCTFFQVTYPLFHMDFMCYGTSNEL